MSQPGPNNGALHFGWVRVCNQVLSQDLHVDASLRYGGWSASETALQLGFFTPTGFAGVDGAAMTAVTSQKPHHSREVSRSKSFLF